MEIFDRNKYSLDRHKNINYLFISFLDLAIKNLSKIRKEKEDAEIKILLNKNQILIQQALPKIDELIDHIESYYINHIEKQNFDSCSNNYGGRDYIIDYLKGNVQNLIIELKALKSRMEALDTNQDLLDIYTSFKAKLVHINIEKTGLDILTDEVLPELKIEILDPLLNFDAIRTKCYKLNSKLYKFFQEKDDKIVLIDDVDDQAILNEIKKVWPSIISKKLEEATKYIKSIYPNK